VVKETQIKAVVFDLGETLLNFGKVETMRVFRQSATQTYDYLISHGQPAGKFWWYFIRNIAAIQVRNLWGKITGRDFDALSLLKSFGIRRGYKLSEEQWREVGWLWYEPLSRIAKVEPDIKETLGKLKGMGLKLGILSNTFISAGSLDRQLGQLGILDFFPYRLYSYQFDFRKPDRRIFEAAIAKTGEPAENILFVGDRIYVDIMPALKMGMHAVLKSAYTNEGKEVPDGVWRIDRISELPGIIEKVNTYDGRPDFAQGAAPGRRKTENRIQRTEDRRPLSVL
jgi:putative hydrolase of the HAD superfamily